MRNEPPWRKSIWASAEIASPGHIHSRMPVASPQASKTSSRDAGINLRITSLSFVSSIRSAMWPLSALLARNNVLFQGVQPDIPEIPAVRNPRRWFAQRRRVKTTAVLAPNDLPPDQAGALQYQNVLRDRVERDRKRPRDFRDSSRLARQVRQHCPARGIGYGRENAVQNVCLMFNQRVEYIPTRRCCQDSMCKKLSAKCGRPPFRRPDHRPVPNYKLPPMDEKLDIREKGGVRNGAPQGSDRRLFMQLLAFGDAEDTSSLVRALEG